MYGRYLCLLKTNSIAVSVKMCTYTSLNWVKGALSDLTGDIVHCISNLQVFELKLKSLPGDLKLEI